MSETKQYRFLEPRAGSNYRQLFLKGKRIRAEVLYRETIGLEPRTPEQVALLGTAPDAEVAAQTCRSVAAVRVVRTRLGIP